jgi:hypothetical protein
VATAKNGGLLVTRQKEILGFVRGVAKNKLSKQKYLS